MTLEHPDDVNGSEVDDDPGASEVDDAADGGGDSAPQPGMTVRRRGGMRLLVPALLAVVLVASAGFASWIYLTEYRPDRETAATVASDTIKAACDGSVALLSYSPETMEKDFATAKSHLTGDFLNYYSQFTHDIVTPAVQQKSVKTSATVVQSAVSELEPGSAVVLLFLNQTTTSKANPAGSFTASSVKVGLTKVDDTWLIASFDPV